MQLRSMPWMRTGLITLGLGLVMAPAALAHGSQAQVPGHAPKHKIGRDTASNWSGYAVDGSSASKVVGTWTQPTPNCAPGENSWSSPWVGIDGDNNNTVEQTGTDSDCRNGRPYYYAWYEMYPKPVVVVPITVNPGDSFTGQVTYGSSGFTLSLTDNTTHANYSTLQTSKKAQRSSVEWIMEGPSNSLLTDFGSVSFTGASATINNTPGALGSFAAATPITMVTAGQAARATPSAISGGSAFTVAFNQH